jgi:hypothetical protein
MRRLSTFTLLVMGGLAVAACGGEMDDGNASDMDVAADDTPACYIANGTMEEAQEKASPLRSTAISVGGHDGLLCYGAPSARGRDIMGGLVVYGQPERIGANEPTTIHFTGPAIIQGVEVEAGSYSIYAIPGAEEWVFFVNSNWQRWGIPIDESVRSSEVGTFTVAAEAMEEYVETLQYRFEPMSENTMGDVVMEWENTRVKFHLHPVEGS